MVESKATHPNSSSIFYKEHDLFLVPIGSMYGIYANIGGILMVNVTIYSIHGSYGVQKIPFSK